MDLGDRKRKILQAIIDDYIETAEPVGSRSISKRHDMGLSPATIRNEMADLEEMGYLDKPHTSAGRIPSQLGYRFYVDSLMSRYSMTPTEKEALKRAMGLRVRMLDQLMEDLSAALSKITRYTTVASMDRAARVIIRGIRLFPIDHRVAVLVLMTDDGKEQNCTVKIPHGVSEEEVLKISTYLDRYFHNVCLQDVSLPMLSEVKKELRAYPEIYTAVVDFLQDAMDRADESEVYVDGASHILNHPEYSDLERAKSLLHFLDDRESVQNLMRKDAGDAPIEIQIGSENQAEEMKNCSLVVSHYRIGDKMSGKIGIIGPTRMDYAKVVSLLEGVTDRLNFLIGGLFFVGDDNDNGKDG